VYDITSPPTLEQLSYFDDLINMMTEELNDSVRKVKVIAGNKCDLASQRTISSAEGLTWARTRGMGFMETSAKLKVNVEETFALIVRRVVEARKAAVEQHQHEQSRESVAEKSHVVGVQTANDDENGKSGCKCCVIS
jgi:GTPase KRas